MVGAYTVLQALQAAHLRAEATLLTPRVARSLTGAAGHCDSDGRRLEELHLLLDDLSNAMPASSGLSASNVGSAIPECREQSWRASLAGSIKGVGGYAPPQWRGAGSSPHSANAASELKAAIGL